MQVKMFIFQLKQKIDRDVQHYIVLQLMVNDIAKYLFSKGANKNTKNNDGKAPYHEWKLIGIFHDNLFGGKCADYIYYSATTTLNES